MLPYVVIESVQLGPVTLHVWGIFVALGILAGTLLASSRAIRFGSTPGQIFDRAIWIVIGGLIGARLWFFLDGDGIPTLWSLARVQDGGLSATGAALGGGLAAFLSLRRQRQSFAAFADTVAPGLLLGEGIGRLGCFAIHDHLGRPTTFPLAVDVLGTPRHDVGLELALAGFLGLIVCTFWESRRPRMRGSVGMFVLFWYAGTRLLLDFLRADDLPVVDARYAGLTLAQYAAMAALLLGGVLWRRARSRVSPVHP